VATLVTVSMASNVETILFCRPYIIKPFWILV